jgi:CDP-glycerol glycerophosphotransferase (TagB/SpsB family)
MAPRTQARSFSNFRFIDDDFLYQNNLLLYQFLGQSDVLISDVSSTIVDFLLLNKPLILSFSDKESYVNSRGINCPEIYSRPPGSICKDQKSIMKALFEVHSGKDDHAENRKYLRQLYHEKTDAKNCTINLLREINLK